MGNELEKVLMTKMAGQQEADELPWWAFPLALAGGGAVAGRLMRRLPRRGLYHGSPHMFNKFSTEFPNSGLGASGHGNGVYLTNNPRTAEMWAKRAASEKVIYHNQRLGGSHVYDVDAKLDHGRFLALDKPLSGQSEYVRGAIRKLSPSLGDDATGFDILSRLGGDEKGSQALHNAGVIGTTYSSHLANNYVVFDPSRLRIRRRKDYKPSKKALKFYSGDG